MHSTIQYQAHTPSLSEFFLSKRYKNFLSEDEKVGRCFAEVVKNITQVMEDAVISLHHTVLAFFLKEFTDDEVVPQYAGWIQRAFLGCGWGLSRGGMAL